LFFCLAKKKKKEKCVKIRNRSLNQYFAVGSIWYITTAVQRGCADVPHSHKSLCKH